MGDLVICPYGQHIVAGLALRLSNQETAVLAFLQYQLLSLLARQMSVEPPANTNTSSVNHLKCLHVFSTNHYSYYTCVSRPTHVQYTKYNHVLKKTSKT